MNVVVAMVAISEDGGGGGDDDDYNINDDDYNVNNDRDKTRTTTNDEMMTHRPFLHPHKCISPKAQVRHGRLKGK